MAVILSFDPQTKEVHILDPDTGGSTPVSVTTASPRELTDTQILVLDILRMMIVGHALNSIPEGDELRATATRILQEQDLSWESLVNFASK